MFSTRNNDSARRDTHQPQSKQQPGRRFRNSAQGDIVDEKAGIAKVIGNICYTKSNGVQPCRYKNRGRFIAVFASKWGRRWNQSSVRIQHIQKSIEDIKARIENGTFIGEKLPGKGQKGICVCNERLLNARRFPKIKRQGVSDTKRQTKKRENIGLGVCS